MLIDTMRNILEKKEKIYKEKQIKNEWLKLQPHRAKMHNILMSQKGISSFDRVIIFQCLAIVSEYVDIYEDSIKNETNLIKAATLEGLSKEQLLIEEIADSVELLKISADNREPLSDRLNAIEKIRNTAWKTAYDLRDQISNILENFEDKLEIEDVGYIFTCISLALLELDLREEEAKILNDMYE
jgi:hypothetical protein